MSYLRSETELDEIRKWHETFLYPTVRVISKDEKGRAAGSGTVIYSRPASEGSTEYETYILTNYHVIANSIKIEDKYDPFLQRNKKKEVRSIVDVDMFHWEYISQCVGTHTLRADIVAWNEERDLALLKLQSTEKAPHVTQFFEGEAKDLHISDEVVAVGAALAHDPIHTKGRITYMFDIIDHYPYIMSTAPTIFGNSGGSLYLWRTGDLIGVPSRITAIQIGFGVDLVNHMSFAIPIFTVKDWLKEQFYHFIYDESITREECEELREQKREEETRLLYRVDKEELRRSR